METVYCLCRDSDGYILEKPTLADNYTPGVGETVRDTSGETESVKQAVWFAWHCWKWDGDNFVVYTPDYVPNIGETPVFIKCLSSDTGDYHGAIDKKIPWDGAFINNEIDHSITVDNTKVIIKEWGIYDIDSAFVWETTSGGGDDRESMEINIFINGDKLPEKGFGYNRDFSPTYYASSHVGTTIELFKDDYVEIGVTNLDTDSVASKAIANTSNLRVRKMCR